MKQRVGYRLDPTAFTPRDLYAYNHRFDDAQKRFRTLYLTEPPETALREVLADFRPNLADRQRHIQRFGAEAADFRRCNDHRGLAPGASSLKARDG